MTWEIVAQIVTGFGGICAMVAAVLRYWFKKEEARRDKEMRDAREKIEARREIKRLENELADVMMSQMKAEIDAIKVAIEDLGDKFFDMEGQYEKLVGKIDKVSIRLDVITEEHESFIKKVKEKINEDFGRTIIK